MAAGRVEGAVDRGGELHGGRGQGRRARAAECDDVIGRFEQRSGRGAEIPERRANAGAERKSAVEHEHGVVEATRGCLEEAVHDEQGFSGPYREREGLRASLRHEDGRVRGGERARRAESVVADEIDGVRWEDASR